jgi:AcrR family transcriptional regulator
MRALASRLGVVPGALYRHVRSKEQLYDLILGFALSDPTSPSEQRVQDTATRGELQAFLRSLPPDRFPALTALGEHVWVDNRDERFTFSFHTLISGLQAAHRPH